VKELNLQEEVRAMKSFRSNLVKNNKAHIKPWRMEKKLIVCLLFFSLMGCLGNIKSSTFTPDYYKTDYDRVWNAAVDTLDELGFVILHMKKDEGYVSTDKRELYDVREKVSIRISRMDKLFRVTINSSRDILVHLDSSNRSEWIKGPRNTSIHMQIKERMFEKIGPYKVVLPQEDYK
jgi:uncharacterized lipoprotein